MIGHTRASSAVFVLERHRRAVYRDAVGAGPYGIESAAGAFHEVDLCTDNADDHSLANQRTQIENLM